MKIYRGKYVDVMDEGILNAVVTVNGEQLPIEPSLKLRNHSPTGFEWGYNGSGPSQLALAILLDCFNKKIALAYYQNFKKDFVSKWGNFWEITAK